MGVVRHAVVVDRPGGEPLALELLVVQVLVEVDQYPDVAGGQQLHDAVDGVEVGPVDRVPLWHHPAEEHAETDGVEAAGGQEVGVGGREPTGIVRCHVGRSLPHRVDAVDQHNASE